MRPKVALSLDAHPSRGPDLPPPGQRDGAGPAELKQPAFQEMLRCRTPTQETLRPPRGADRVPARDAGVLRL